MQGTGAPTIQNFEIFLSFLSGKEHVVGALRSSTKEENYSNFARIFCGKNQLLFPARVFEKGKNFRICKGFEESAL